MNLTFPFLLAIVAGFSHAFEADHLVAVSSIVTHRRTARAAIRDGAFWGLGHTSTILLVAGVYLLGRYVLHPSDFRYLEAGVGAMLVGLGAFRLRKLHRTYRRPLPHRGAATGHAPPEPTASLAYGVGMVHGLAGSGALLLSVLTQIKGNWNSVGYLLIFGFGTVAGMMVAAGMLSLPFSTAALKNQSLHLGLTVVSSLVCAGLGMKILYENLAG